jgi:uncharacterized protein YndB with AHSA1/START domain
MNAPEAPDGENSGEIRWRLHLRSPPANVFRMLATDEGRASFWVQSSAEAGGVVGLCFSNGERWRGRILEVCPPHRFSLEYLEGSRVTFELLADGQGGTELTLSDRGVAAGVREEVAAGWVSVLLALKAAVDFGVDLRNHDPERTWSTGFVDN